MTPGTYVLASPARNTSVAALFASVNCCDGWEIIFDILKRYKIFLNNKTLNCNISQRCRHINGSIEIYKSLLPKKYRRKQLSYEAVFPKNVADGFVNHEKSKKISHHFVKVRNYIHQITTIHTTLELDKKRRNNIVANHFIAMKI